MEKAVVPLDLCHLCLRVELDELGVLIGGEDEEVLSLQQRVQIPVWLPHRGRAGCWSA